MRSERRQTETKREKRIKKIRKRLRSINKRVAVLNHAARIAVHPKPIDRRIQVLLDQYDTWESRLAVAECG